MKTRQHNFGRRKGTTILAALILIPIGISLYMLLLNRIDVAQAEAQRHQYRTQARLLAESALARLQSEPTTEASLEKIKNKPLEGAIDGIGRYTLAGAGSAPSGQRIKATGAVDGKKARYICEIEIEVPSTPPAAQTGGSSGKGPSIRLLGMTHHFQLISR